MAAIATMHHFSPFVKILYGWRFGSGGGVGGMCVVDDVGESFSCPGVPTSVLLEFLVSEGLSNGVCDISDLKTIEKKCACLRTGRGYQA